MLSRYGIDLTNLAEKGALKPVTISDGDVEHLMQVLCKQRKNNACFIGRSGIRVASIVEGLAQRIADGSAPRKFRGKKVINLKKQRLLAGCKSTSTDRFKDRLVGLVSELRKADGMYILFFDDLDLLVLFGGIVNQCIGAMTAEEYEKHVESNSSLRDRFCLVDLPDLSMDEIIKLLRVMIVRYEAHHSVQYMDEALIAAAQLSRLHTGNELLIDKAIDMIDEAGARVSLEMVDASARKGVVTRHHIEQLIPSTTRCFNPNLRAYPTPNKSKQLCEMEKALQRHVVGQEDAVEAISRALLRAWVGIRDTGRPIASFFFTGPTGVGKTELANAVASEFFGSINAMVRLDMSEYKEQHSVAKLFGAPPGYLSCTDGGQLTEAVLKNPRTVVLFDEIEKAHHNVYDVFLQLLENGRLTDGRGTTVDFTNTIIIFTSNIGYKLFDMKNTSGSFGLENEQLKQMIMEELKKVFRPELLNRLDDILVFRQLTPHDLGKILELLLNKVCQRVKDMNLCLEIRDSVKKKLIQEGYDPAFGARPLRRCITRVVEDALAQWIADGEVNKGDHVVMDLDAYGNVIKYVTCATDTETASTRGNHTFTFGEEPVKVRPVEMKTMYPTMSRVTVKQGLVAAEEERTTKVEEQAAKEKIRGLVAQLELLRGSLLRPDHQRSSSAEQWAKIEKIHGIIAQFELLKRSRFLSREQRAEIEMIQRLIGQELTAAEERATKAEEQATKEKIRGLAAQLQLLRSSLLHPDHQRSSSAEQWAKIEKIHGIITQFELLKSSRFLSREQRAEIEMIQRLIAQEVTAAEERAAKAEEQAIKEKIRGLASQLKLLRSSLLQPNHLRSSSAEQWAKIEKIHDIIAQFELLKSSRFLSPEQRAEIGMIQRLIAPELAAAEERATKVKNKQQTKRYKG